MTKATSNNGGDYLEEANIDDDSCEYYVDPEDDCDECGICDEEYTYKFTDILYMSNNLGCTSCHSSNGLSGGLDLNSYTSIMSLTTNSGGVINNCLDVESSVILQKIDGGSMANYADQELIDAVRIWISEGAPE